MGQQTTSSHRKYIAELGSVSKLHEVEADNVDNLPFLLTLPLSKDAKTTVIDRPGVAGAVLQTASLLTYSLIQSAFS